MTRPSPGPLPVRIPRRKAPPGTCDAHIHVIGPYDRFPLHPDRSYTTPEAPMPEYREFMRVLGIDRVVVVQPGAHGCNNDLILDAIAQVGEAARGVAVVPPDVTDAELDRLHAGGVRGMRLVTPNRGGVGPQHAEFLAKRVARLGMHLQFLLTGPQMVQDLAPMLASLPVPVVIDSFGRTRPENGVDHPGFQALLRLMEGGNCWVKFNSVERRSRLGPPYADITPLAKAMIGARPDRIVWGTDWPHVMAFDHPIPNDADLLEWIMEMDIDDATRRAILIDNPVHLYGFNPE